VKGIFAIPRVRKRGARKQSLQEMYTLKHGLHCSRDLVAYCSGPKPHSSSRRQKKKSSRKYIYEAYEWVPSGDGLLPWIQEAVEEQQLVLRLKGKIQWFENNCIVKRAGTCSYGGGGFLEGIRPATFEDATGVYPPKKDINTTGGIHRWQQPEQTAKSNYFLGGIKTRTRGLVCVRVRSSSERLPVRCLKHRREVKVTDPKDCGLLFSSYKEEERALGKERRQDVVIKYPSNQRLVEEWGVLLYAETVYEQWLRVVQRDASFSLAGGIRLRNL